MIAAVVLLAATPTTSCAYPPWWIRQASCIRHYESGSRWSIRDAPYGGAYQFEDGTWSSFRPTAFPLASWLATPAQQTLVAWRVWLANGRRWGGNQWPVTSKLCGVP